MRYEECGIGVAKSLFFLNVDEQLLHAAAAAVGNYI